MGKQKISFSKLNLYDMCPEAYRYQTVEHKSKAVPEHSLKFFGNYLHAFVPRLWDKKSGNIRYQNSEAFVNSGTGYFWQWVRGRLPGRQRKIRFEGQWEPGKYAKWAKSILKGYYLKNKDLPMPIEMEKSYTFDWKDFHLTGRLDRVDEHDINGKKERVIIDYKLGKPDRDLLKVHHGLQFTLYSLAYEFRHGERIPVIWYSLSTGKLFPTQRDEEDYDLLEEKLKEFKMNVESGNFPHPDFDNPFCGYCDYSSLCAEKYPDAWSRRKERGETDKKTVVNVTADLPLIDTNPQSWIEALYGPDSIIRPIKEIKVGPRRYAIFGDLEEAGKALSLSAFSYWKSSVEERGPGYVILESETGMPKTLKERLQSKGLDVYEKIRETKLFE